MASTLTVRARLPGRPFAGGGGPGLKIGPLSHGSPPGRGPLKNPQPLEPPPDPRTARLRKRVSPARKPCPPGSQRAIQRHPYQRPNPAQPVGAPAGSPGRPGAKGNQPGTNSVPARFATGGSSGTPAKRPNPPQAVGAPAPGAKVRRTSAEARCRLIRP